MSYALEHLAAFAVLLLLFWLPGYVLERNVVALRDPGGQDRPDLRRLARWCLGVGAWTVASFALASLGQLHRGAVVVLAGAAVLAALWTRARAPSTPSARLTSQESTWHRVLLVVLPATALAPLLMFALSSYVSWDASAYHLTLPKLYIENGGFRPVEMSLFSNWPLGTELLFSVAMLLDDHVVAKLVHLGFGVGTLYAVYVACRSARARSGASALAMAFFLANGVVAFELCVAYVDLAHAFFLITAFLFAHQALEHDGEGALLVAGISSGLMAGVKLPGIVGGFIIGTMLLPRVLRAMRRGEGAAAVRTVALYFALPAVGLWLPWLLKSALYTGNAFYPLMYGQFGGPDWSAQLGQQFGEWQSGIGMGRAPLDYLLLPLRVVLSGDLDYGHFGQRLGRFWVVVLPLGLWGAIGSRLTRRALFVAGAYFLFWAASSQQARFLIPVLPLLAVASAWAVADLIARLPSQRRRRLAVTLALVVAWGLVAHAGRPYHRQAIAASASYRSGEGDAMQAFVPQVFRYVNRELPADAKLLFLNTNQGFACDRAYLSDSVFEASQIAAWLRPATTVVELRRLLAERGITHLVIRQRGWGIDFPQALSTMLADPHHIEGLYEDRASGHVLVAILPGSP